MLDTEAMLLVDRDETEPGKHRALLDERVSPDYQQWRVRAHLLRSCRPFFRVETSGHENRLNVERLEQLRDRPIVLLSEKLSWHHHSCLISVLHCEQRCEESDYRLPASDITLQHAMHLPVAAHVVDDLANRAHLRLSE